MRIGDYKRLVKNWFSILENNSKISSRINNIIEGNNLIFFFKINDKIFGAPEESRLVFAKIKNKDKDISPTANFMGFNLEKAMLGQEIMNLFSKKDIPNMKVLSKEQTKKLLSNKKIEGKSPKLTTFEDDNDDPGVISLDDKS